MGIINNIQVKTGRFAQRGKWGRVLVKLVQAPLFWILLLSGIIRAIYYSVLLNTVAVDTASYLNYDANILKGETEGRRTPVYPYFIKLAGLFNRHNVIDSVAIAQIIISFLSIIVFYNIVRRVFKSTNIAFAASLLYGLMLPLINFDKVIITESLSVSFCLFFIYLMLNYLQKPVHLRAWALTLFTFLAIILRPSFIYMLPLVIMFWLLRLMLCKQERRLSASGLAASVVVVLLLSGYSALNKINTGFNGISLVSNNNEMAVIVSAGIYCNGNDPEISAAIQSNIMLEQKYPGQHIPGINIMARFKPDRVHRFIIACIKNEPATYVRYIGTKLLDLRTENIFTNYADHKLSSLAFRMGKVEYAVFRLPFIILYIIIIVHLLLIIAGWIRLKQVPWFNICLWLIITGQLAVAIMGGYSEYQRLILAAIPALIIVLFSYTDKIYQEINKRIINTYPASV